MQQNVKIQTKTIGDFSTGEKPMVNLWKAKTIFTLADKSLKDEEEGSSGSAAGCCNKKGRSTVEPDPTAALDEPTTLLALGRSPLLSQVFWKRQTLACVSDFGIPKTALATPSQSWNGSQLRGKRVDL